MRVSDYLHAIPSLREQLAQCGIEGRQAERLIQAATAQLCGHTADGAERLPGDLDAGALTERLDARSIAAHTGLSLASVTGGIRTLAVHAGAFEQSRRVLARLGALLGTR